MKKLILAGMMALVAGTASAREINGNDLNSYLKHGGTYLSQIIACGVTLTLAGCENAPILSDKDIRTTLGYKMQKMQLDKLNEPEKKTSCHAMDYPLVCRDLGFTE